MSSQVIQTSDSERAGLVNRGRRLEYLTIGWNVLEGLVAIGAGLIAGSTALVGFGFDSFIESLSGGALWWRLRSDENAERGEQIALKLVGVSFLVLAAYAAFDAGKSLVYREPLDTSYAGIGARRCRL